MTPFTNLKLQNLLIKDQLTSAFTKTVDSGWYVLGDQLKVFEENFAKYIGCKYCAGVASGTDAITIALMALGVGNGDEVITSNITAFATITGIINSGAQPVVVDINEESGLIDCSLIEQKITDRTKAIVAVHLYGQCCDMDQLKLICKKYNLFLIEDAAQAAGSMYNNRKAGSFGDCGAFSFYPTKNLGAIGDGGAIVTNDKEIYTKFLMLRNYGQKNRYIHDLHGLNSRLDELQASILNVKLNYLDNWNTRRNAIANYYKSNLQNVELLKTSVNVFHNYHLFVVKHPQRNSLIDYLGKKGIQSLIHYPVPINLQNAFNYQKDEELIKSRTFANSIFSLPMYPELEDREVEMIVKTVNLYEGNYK